MPFITTKDGTEIFYKDWGPQGAADRLPSRLAAQRRRLGHPDAVLPAARAIASSPTTAAATAAPSQTDDGNDMDTYAADVAELVARARPARTRSTSAIRPAAARSPATWRAHEPGRVAKAVLIGAVPPLMVKTDGQPRRHADRGVRRLPRRARRQPAQFYLDVAVRPVLRLQPAGREGSEGVIRNWWRQGMMGGAKAHYDCIKAFSETDFTEDLKEIDVPVLVMHGEDDQIVPYRRLARRWRSSC